MARICPNPTCGKRYPDEVAFCGECGSITIQEQLPNDHDPRLGQRLGEYLVVARVADGAMGRVYEGRHFDTRERVAIKVLHSAVARDPVSVERFKREYETARDLAHPYIVRVIDFGGTPDGSSFLTMEFLEGEELGKMLRRGQLLEPARLVRTFAQLALGLDHAHSFGVIHRDLKPDNIFLCRSADGDVVRILDFGSVKLQMDTGPKLTAFGTTLGSPFYMSPEQAMGKQDVDLRTDVFALAAILYECCTGKVAFDAQNIAQILMKIINEPVTPPSQQVPGLPPRLDDVVDRGLRKDKRSRYASASLLAAGLCDAYGLEANVTRWAAASMSEIAQSLSTSAPPPAGAFVESIRPGAELPLNRRDSLPARPPVHGSGVMIGVAVGAVAVVALVAALLLR
ncbi:MAG: serine/threonine protein kinase [Myxococcaceae bacterium]|nr:serine/threonine protein kinase [Myxococcaceae bacterium]